MTNIVQMANVRDDLWSDAELATLDPANFAWWTDGLAEAQRSTRRLRKRLLRLAEGAPGSARSCVECGGSMLGRSDQRCCSAACRQRSYRRRHAEP